MSRREVHSDLLVELQKTLLQTKGDSSTEVREQAMNGVLEGPLGEYVKMVRDRAYKIAPAMLEELRKSYSDDFLFEITLVVSLGEARRRHDLAMSAIDSAWGKA